MNQKTCWICWIPDTAFTHNQHDFKFNIDSSTLKRVLPQCGQVNSDRLRSSQRSLSMHIWRFDIVSRHGRLQSFSSDKHFCNHLIFASNLATFRWRAEVRSQCRITWKESACIIVIDIRIKSYICIEKVDSDNQILYLFFQHDSDPVDIVATSRDSRATDNGTL